MASPIRHCPVRGCTNPRGAKALMCSRHWAQVPRVLKQAVWDTYRPGQERDKNVSGQWRAAAKAAIASVQETVP